MRVAQLAVALLLAYAAAANGRSTTAEDAGPIRVSKSVDPTVLEEPQGSVTYSVTITNDSDEVAWIEDIVDDRFGDLDDEGGSACFDAPIGLRPDEHVNCMFRKTISGFGGSSHVNNVQVSGHDGNGDPISAGDDARVNFTARLIDLTLTKDATPVVGLNELVRYSVAMHNAGPETATNVQMADPAPRGIEYRSATPSQGACDVRDLGGHLVTCHLGDIAAGQTVRVEITARATERGSHTNTATVTGSGGRETNPADNVDSARTVVPFCLELAVAPTRITAARDHTILARVTLLEEPVRRVKVTAVGLGLEVAARTRADGVARLRVVPRRTGALVISTPGTRRPLCAVKRVRVVSP